MYYITLPNGEGRVGPHLPKACHTSAKSTLWHNGIVIDIKTVESYKVYKIETVKIK